MPPVKFDELLLAFEFVSAGAPYEHEAYISRKTGTFYYVSELAGLDEGPPEDEDTDDLIAVPHKHDLDLGRNLVFWFVEAEMPDAEPEVAAMFRRKGAYRRLKEFLETRGMLDKWHAFQAEVTEKTLREWCAENEIPLIDG